MSYDEVVRVHECVMKKLFTLRIVSNVLLIVAMLSSMYMPDKYNILRSMIVGICVGVIASMMVNITSAIINYAKNMMKTTLKATEEVIDTAHHIYRDVIHSHLDNLNKEKTVKIMEELELKTINLKEELYERIKFLESQL